MIRLWLLGAAVAGVVVVGALYVVRHSSNAQASPGCSAASADGSLTCTLGSRQVVVLSSVCNPLDPSLGDSSYAQARYDPSGSASSPATGSHTPVAYSAQGTIVSGQSAATPAPSAPPAGPGFGVQVGASEGFTNPTDFAVQLAGLLASLPTNPTPTGTSVSCK